MTRKKTKRRNPSSLLCGRKRTRRGGLHHHSPKKTVVTPANTVDFPMQSLPLIPPSDLLVPVHVPAVPHGETNCANGIRCHERDCHRHEQRQGLEGRDEEGISAQKLLHKRPKHLIQ